MRKGMLLAAALTCSACGGDEDVFPPVEGQLAAGTWGGNDAGVVVNTTATHVHIGCTNGNFPAPVQLNSAGRFTIQGSYVLRAFPVAMGPSLPAELVGIVRGRELTISLTVNDTVEKKVVVMGPVTVTFGSDPRMRQCPICEASLRDNPLQATLRAATSVGHRSAERAAPSRSR